MVSPRTSSLYRASSTSFSFSGRTIATISFMSNPPAGDRRPASRPRPRSTGLPWLHVGGRRAVGHHQDRALAARIGLLPVLGHVHTHTFFLASGAHLRHE